MASLRGYACTCLLLACATASATRAADGPSWYKKKTQKAEEQKQEQILKDQETPIVDGDEGLAPSELSVPKKVKPETNLLFKQKGLTDTFGLEYVSLNQDRVDGPTAAAHFSMGWWWQPDLIVGPFGRIAGTLWENHTILWASLGVQGRFLISRKWAFTSMIGYTYSQGLSAKETARIPMMAEAVRARHGILFGGQVNYFAWAKRDLGLGPALGFWTGSQDERSITMLTLGITLQAGRPDYTGDLTER